MLIDWFTVGAQALNFVILVWLMKRFLYRPILAAIGARENRVAAELADAAMKKTEAKTERDEFQRQNEELGQRRAALLKTATDEAGAERRRLLDEARRMADDLSAKRDKALKDDARSLNQAIGRRVQEEVFAIARSALADLATTSLEERLGDVFIRRLREMDGSAKAAFAKALETASAPAVVRSALELPEVQRAAIQSAVGEAFSTDIRVRFETAPNLVSGIELATNGQKVGWTIAQYLTSLEQTVGAPSNRAEPEAGRATGAGAELTPRGKAERRAEEPKEERRHL